jgi:uncharacterized surface anchored protein
VAGQTVTERFVNPRLATFVLEKIDGDTQQPLTGVIFEITTLAGEKIRNPQDGSFDFITDNAGMIRLPQLEAGSYVAVETKALFGYALAKPEVFEVGHDKDYIITVRNYKLPDYNILKIDGNTDKPLAGVPFEIASYYSNGRVGDRIRNPQDSSYTWMTDSAGMIRIPNLNHGTYVATEVRPPAGYSKADPAIFVVGDNEPTTITVRNYRYSEWNILKINGDTNKPLQGVVFEVVRYYGEGSTGEKLRDANGNIEFITDSEGMIRLGVLEPGTYSAIETKPLDGYIKAEPTIFTVMETDENTTVTIRNYKRPVYNISKIDGDTNKPLQGVVFELAKYFDNGSSRERVRNPIDGSFEFVTDAAGIITIPTLPLATYVATEIRPLPGYAAAEPQVFVVDDIQDTTITIRNYRNPDFAIRKLDGDTREPLAGVQFQIFKALGNGGSGEIVRNPADNNDIWMTDSAGLIHMNALEPGAYIAAETKPLPGYTAAEPVTFTVGGSGDAIVTIFNYRLPDYAIKKVDGETNAPLAGVAFEISRSLGDGRNGERLINPADGSAIFVTDSAGMINLPGLEPGNYIATETKALQGYTAAEPKPFTVGAGGSQTIVIQNFRLPDFSIQKVDGDTQQPLAGVAFEISRHLGEGQNGERLVNPADGTNIFVTDSAGMINLPGIAPGMYMAIETRPLKGYLTAEPAIFTVGDGQNRTVVIQNFNRGETTIKKADADTGDVLPGVVFEISRLNGEKVQNPVDNTFEFVTDNAGLIPLGFLTAGTYTAVETRPLEGYEAGQPTTFEVKDGGDLTVLIKNQKQSSLTVRKLNSVTREPIEGVAFQLSLPNGEKIVNPKTGFYDFITDNRGIIFLPALEDGAYWLTEIKAADGYFGLKEPVLVEINNETRQREYLLEIENEPASGLLIIKTDAQTKKPLAGVIFEIRHADGRVVQGGILNENMPNTLNNSPQLNSMNGFTTDESGRINLNHLEPGLYHVIEKEPLDGYELDTGVRVVTVEPGTQAVLEVENKPLSGLRIRKLDSITGEPIFGVEFMLFDQNGKPVGNFYSDDRGVVDFPAILVAGRYTIRETRPAEGYNADDMPRTVDFVPGKVTEIEWTNVPIGGQLQISKVSGDYNEQNALPAGTLLPGAIFEIYSYRTGSLVDRIISDQRGMAVSKPLPLGRYYAVEVQAPAYYTVNPSQIDFDIEFDRQIVKTMFPNFSANLGVTIDKTGPRETMQGHSIVYDFKTVRNDSSVPLGDFYWRDILPVDAVRADKLVTGTYNVSLRYKVIGKTNYGNEVVIADNLITTSNNVIELKPVHLGLAGDEFLTEFTLYFGQAPAGFTAVEKPKVYVDVLWESYAILPNGMMFANKADIGGRVAGSEEWVVGNSTTATTIFSTRKMPQSGY